MITHYQYANPAFLPPSRITQETHRFLGFRKTIRTTVPSGENGSIRRVEREFAYDENGDPSGRVIKERIYQGEDGEFKLQNYTETTWKQVPLFGDKLFFTHRDLTLTRTCAAAATEPQCLTQEDNVRRIKEVWLGFCAPLPGFSFCLAIFPNPNPHNLYVRGSTLEGSGLTIGDLDRRTTFGSEVRYGRSGLFGFRPDDYRILPRKAVTEAASRTGGEWQFRRVGQTDTQYNAEGLPEHTDHWINETTFARTKRTFDPNTGNLLTKTKPEQGAPGGSGKSTKFRHDDHKLFVEETINELEHSVFTTYDVGTGELLARRGPNLVVLDGGEERWEHETWKIDGFGRVLQRSVSIDDELEGYKQQSIAELTYIDSEASEIRQRLRRDFDGTIWIESHQELDGFGRVHSETQHLNGDLSAVTNYHYDEAGNISSIEVPDPSDDNNHVRYSYEYDGVGRVTRFARPDDSGVSVIYAGLEETHTEIASDQSGSKTKLIYDVFGRIIEVDEFESEISTATTTYRYDANDNVVRIEDADGSTTGMLHDWVRNPTTIQRGNRFWFNIYDRNGNKTREIDPRPRDADPERYSTQYKFDDLDRVVSVTPDHSARSMSAARLAELGIGPIRYIYDRGRNGIGRIQQVKLPFGEVTYQYSARGLVASEERNFELSSPVAINHRQSVTRHYNPLGGLTLSEWDDGQKWRTIYDERALVDRVEWYDPRDDVWKAVADYERTVAGQPRKRLTDFSQLREFVYDTLGRPFNDLIFATNIPGSEPISRRLFTYYDSGDLKSVSGNTGDFWAAANYTYDRQHRLRTASGPNGYSGNFTYSPAGNIETAHVSWNGSSHARNVRYEYGEADPHAVDRLVNLDDETPYANFEYDAPGNMKSRRVLLSGDTWNFAWGPEDQLREAARETADKETYYYDQDNVRILAINENGVRIWFSERESQYDRNGQLQKRYVHLSNNGTTLARVENDTDIELQYTDTLRNLMLSLDDQGDIVTSFLYGPFGEVVESIGAENHRRQFNGKEHDLKTGLRYYGFRYYDPLILRWNSADPLYRVMPELGLREAQRLNLYSFSLNNPLKYFDPDGRQPYPAQGNLVARLDMIDQKLARIERNQARLKEIYKEQRESLNATKTTSDKFKDNLRGAQIGISAGAAAFTYQTCTKATMACSTAAAFSAGTLAATWLAPGSVTVMSEKEKLLILETMWDNSIIQSEVARRKRELEKLKKELEERIRESSKKEKPKPKPKPKEEEAEPDIEVSQ